MLQLTPVFENLTNSCESYEYSRETSPSNQEVTLTWMLQQNFPRIEIPTAGIS